MTRRRKFTRRKGGGVCEREQVYGSPDPQDKKLRKRGMGNMLVERTEGSLHKIMSSKDIPLGKPKTTPIR